MLFNLQDDIFGPFLGVYVYEDSKLDEAVELVDSTSSYGLTGNCLRIAFKPFGLHIHKIPSFYLGAVFAQDEAFIERFTDRMIDTVGNFYINVQSTGSVVGNQPFGGARLSGKCLFVENQYHLPPHESSSK